ncbi:HPt (histidine-containing phosphotransfer) domain-containing protein [Pedobacter sp. CG_S7]|uniref:Hpt domain-containing protein n=1 Tax=Pedobacter sp. CG_S7 TaxID=3143930 RepID=UPI003393777F
MFNVEKNKTPLDLSYLSDMSGDSPEFMVEMIDMFKQQTPLYIADLKQAISDGDWSKVSSCAHKIKPTFAYVGREDARDHMQVMEHDARDLKNLEELIVKFEEINEFMKVLNKQLDEARAELEKRIEP